MDGPNKDALKRPPLGPPKRKTMQEYKNTLDLTVSQLIDGNADEVYNLAFIKDGPRELETLCSRILLFMQNMSSTSSLDELILAWSSIIASMCEGGDQADMGRFVLSLAHFLGQMAADLGRDGIKDMVADGMEQKKREPIFIEDVDRQLHLIIKGRKEKQPTTNFNRDYGPRPHINTQPILPDPRSVLNHHINSPPMSTRREEYTYQQAQTRFNNQEYDHRALMSNYRNYTKVDSNILPFEGTVQNEDPILWLVQFERGARRHGWTDHDKLIQVSSYLEGPALQWFDHAQEYIHEWKDGNDLQRYTNNSFYGQFHTNFVTANMKYLWQQLYQNCKFVRKDTTITFANRLRELHKRCEHYAPTSEANLIMHYKQNLPAEIREKLLSRLDVMDMEYQIQQYSFDSIVRIAQRVELFYIDAYGSLPYEYSCDQVEKSPFNRNSVVSIYMQPWVYESLKKTRYASQPMMVTNRQIAPRYGNNDGRMKAPTPKNDGITTTTSEQKKPTCYKCNTVGHFANKCPQKFNKKEITANVATTEQHDEEYEDEEHDEQEYQEEEDPVYIQHCNTDFCLA
ncbi:hypothetical protein BDF19DRAFT_431755 [Syncephalis fuscata]|nr:hypothetical protein BDF19DRAFT_431755 [Syncephalis fuscata]